MIILSILLTFFSWWCMDIVRRRFILVLTSWDFRVNKFRLCSDRVWRVQIVIFLHLCGFRLMFSNLLTGSGGVFSISGFGQNTERDSCKWKISWRDTGFDCYSGNGFAKILARDVVLGKITAFGIEMAQVRDVGLLWKRRENAGPGHGRGKSMWPSLQRCP